MQFDKAYSFLIKKLESELPKTLYYHNASHTKDVVEYAELLAASENISEPDVTILKTAALFHDSGYLKINKGHEEVSREIAKEFLPKFEYNEEEIAQICELIMATKMPQSPHNKLAEILCDADLYYMSTDSYIAKADKLYKEMHEAGTVKDRNDWRNIESKFLQTHHYFTNSAKNKLGNKVKQNEEHLRENEFGYKTVKQRFGKYDWVADIFLICIGVIFAAFALKGFLVPNRFFDGGVTGISLLIHEIYKINLAYVIVLANLPFIITCIYAVNFKYALKTFICVVLLGISFILFPELSITHDKLLISVFGGFFLGIGVGLTMRAGCAIDGIEVLALYTWRRTSFTITEIILAINIVIFSIAAFKFGIEVALYSILTYFTASKTVDYVVEGLEAYIGVTIISAKSETVKDRLVNELGRGITIYKGERGYLPGKFDTHEDVDIIFTVVTRLELRKLKNLVHSIDSRAFVFATMIREAAGGIIKRRHLH